MLDVSKRYLGWGAVSVCGLLRRSESGYKLKSTFARTCGSYGFTDCFLLSALENHGNNLRQIHHSFRARVKQYWAEITAVGVLNRKASIRKRCQSSWVPIQILSVFETRPKNTRSRILLGRGCYKAGYLRCTQPSNCGLFACSNTGTNGRQA